ncbi:MAG TPA: sigma-70 family RNA polymerase sigma factor [Pyrinomonadaceae bacterium]
MQAALKPLRLVRNEPAGELETLFQTHHGRVFRTAQRITGSAADAEDVLQNVFLRLVKGQETYDLSRNPEAYLSRAAINASLDLLRSRTRSKSVTLGEADTETLPSRSRSPEALHADQELQTLVRQAVARLGKTAGEMFVLRYYEGLDNKEIAVMMETSPLVVGVVLHRARTKLRKEIGHYLEKHHEKE